MFTFDAIANTANIRVLNLIIKIPLIGAVTLQQKGTLYILTVWVKSLLTPQVLLDYTKAFDRIFHHLLLATLYNIGMSDFAEYKY